MNLEESVDDEKAVTGKRWASRVKWQNVYTSGRVNYLEERAVNLIPAEFWVQAVCGVPLFSSTLSVLRCRIYHSDSSLALRQAEQRG